MNILFFLLFNIIYSQSTQVGDYSMADFTNLKAERTINLKNKIIQVTNKVIIKSARIDPIYSYRYILTKNASNSLIHLSVEMTSESNKDERVEDLKIIKVAEDSDFIYYDITFKKFPMNNEEERILTVKEDYFERLQFYPKKIHLREDQYALYTDTLNYLSAYPTNKQDITVILPNEKTSLVKYTMTKSNKSKDKVTYSFTNIFPAFKIEPLYYHYEYNEPFTVMNYAHKHYQISHWGNIAVSEDYQIENIGATLDGEFGRVDYDDYGRQGGKSALKYLVAKLPIRSWGLWYRDEIGNVSTSNAIREWDDVKLVLYPRFPILGGWKSNFDIGYNLPSKFHIKTNDQGNYLVNLTFGMPYPDILAKNYTVTVNLPEGAEVTKVDLPVDGKYEISYEKEYGCLDLLGRKSVVIKMNNVYDIHKVHFQIYYNYSSWALASKPLILIVYFFVIFASLIVYFRANLSLDRKDDEKEKTE